MQQLFLYDIPVYFVQTLARDTIYTAYLECLSNKLISRKTFLHTDHILIKTNETGFKQILLHFPELFSTKPQSITVWLEEGFSIDKLLGQHFKILRAAGGIVRQGKHILMIYRLCKWDLPKGSIEVGEEPAIAAVREIAEECEVQAVPISKLCLTGHNYMQNTIPCLKETTWYILDCLSDIAMKPQREEGITQVAWITLDRLQETLAASYPSIQYVFQVYAHTVSPE